MKRPKRTPLAGLLAFALLLATARARAQGPASQVLFEQGRAALAAGDLATACARFRASDQMDPSSGARANLGKCEERRGRLASAWEAFRSALEKLPPSDDRAPQIQTWINALTPRLPHLVLVLAPDAPSDTTATEAGVTIGSTATSGIALPFDPGPHRFTVTAAGHAPRSVEVVLVEGQTARVTFGPGPTQGATEQGVHANPGPWIVGALGLASLVVGGVTGALVLQKKSAASAGCSDATRTCTRAGKDAADAGRVLGPITTTTLVAGALGVAAGAIWLGVRSSNRPSTAIGVGPLVGGAAVQVEGSW